MDHESKDLAGGRPVKAFFDDDYYDYMSWDEVMGVILGCILIVLGILAGIWYYFYKKGSVNKFLCWSREEENRNPISLNQQSGYQPSTTVTITKSYNKTPTSPNGETNLSKPAHVSSNLALNDINQVPVNNISMIGPNPNQTYNTATMHVMNQGQAGNPSFPPRSSYPQPAPGSTPGYNTQPEVIPQSNSPAEADNVYLDLDHVYDTPRGKPAGHQPYEVPVPVDPRSSLAMNSSSSITYDNAGNTNNQGDNTYTPMAAYDNMGNTIPAQEQNVYLDPIP